MNAGEIVEKAVARSQRTEGAAPASFNYTKITLTEEFDSGGKITDRKQRVYEVSYRSGLTRAQLKEINGHAPNSEDRKKQLENETGLSRLLGQPKDTRGDNRETFLTPELVDRFQFRLVGTAAVNGRPAYQLSFRPKSPEPPVHRLIDRLLNRISGTLWIDQEEFEIARTEIVLNSEVNLLGGLAASLKKLSYTLVRTRVADGVWFNTLSSGDFEGRKLFEFARIKTQSAAINFQPGAIGKDKEGGGYPGSFNP